MKYGLLTRLIWSVEGAVGAMALRMQWMRVRSQLRDMAQIEKGK